MKLDTEWMNSGFSLHVCNLCLRVLVSLPKKRRSASDQRWDHVHVHVWDQIHDLVTPEPSVDGKCSNTAFLASNCAISTSLMYSLI